MVMRSGSVCVAVAVALMAVGAGIAVPAGATLRAARGVSPAAVMAGTSIGNAGVLTGSVSGSLATSLVDDWYVVYPASPGGPITATVTNTTSGAYPFCDSATFSFFDTVGSSASTISSASPSPGTAPYPVTLQKPQSDRYFIEVTSSCSPPSSEPITYTVNVTGPFGTPPKLAQGTAKPSLSIDAGPPLHGATSYIGTVQSNYADNWYGLIKKNDVTPATIRVENTTIKSSACSSSSLTVAFRDTNGDWLLGGGSPGSNKAIVEPIVGPGTYEIELTTSCDSGGVTYRIEAEPASEWVTTPVVHQSLPTGPSQASAGGPLAPKIAYTGLAPAVNTTIYAKFAYSGTTSGTAQVLNTTPVLNPAQPPCGTVRFNIVDPNQAILLDGTPPMNHGYTISLGVPGTYYVTATTEPTSTSCPPSVRQHVLVRLTGTTPPRVAAEDLHISPPEQALIKNYEGVAGSGGKPVPKPYKDATGNCTVGWGHKLHNGPCTASERATTYNMAQIVQFWTQDIAKAESRIKSAVPTLPLLQQEFDALGDFAFNLGAICGTGFETLCADLKAENYSAVPAAFLLYVKGTVKGIKGKVPFCNLYQRRTDEGQTWTSADYNRDYPSCPSGYR